MWNASNVDDLKMEDYLKNVSGISNEDVIQ